MADVAPASPPAASAAPPSPAAKVRLINKFAFGAGDFGPAVAASVIGYFLLIFFTDVAGLSPSLAGLVLLLTKAWDAVNDPIMGYLSDRVRTRWGRRRPWFLFGAIPFGLAFFLHWLVPPFGETGKFWYYLGVSLLFDTAFTIVNTPYTALTAEMTSDFDERTSLNSFRFAFSIGGQLFALVVHQMIVGSFGADVRGGYVAAGAILGLFASLPFFFAFWGTYERADAPQETELPFWEGMKTTFANVPFRYASGVYLCSWLATSIVQTVLAFYIQYWLRLSDYLLPILFGLQISSFVWLFIWSRLSQRLGKKGVYYRGIAVLIAVLLALFALPASAPFWLVLALALCAGVGTAVSILIPWSILPDVIELDELETGQRREGAFYGFFVLLQKLGVALGLFLIGQLLELTGYVSAQAGVASVEQPASALAALRWIIGPIPAALLAMGIVLMWRYPITKERHAATLAELERRRAAKVLGADPAPSH
ncbi:MAG TPA: MFS transporter [Herpetosiphonaceae bacterium]